MNDTVSSDLQAELEHFKRMALTYRQNYYHLQEQKAHYGVDVPLWLHNALKDQDEELKRCEERISSLESRLSQMFPQELSDILQLAKETVREGANKAREYYLERERIEVVSREEIKNLTTRADEDANQEIIKRIKERYPKHQIISEEGGVVSSSPADKGFTWIVDAIDGTVNFFLKFPMFCTAIWVVKNMLKLIKRQNNNELTKSTDKTGSNSFFSAIRCCVFPFNMLLTTTNIETKSIIAAANQRIHDQLGAIVSAIYAEE